MGIHMPVVLFPDVIIDEINRRMASLMRFSLMFPDNHKIDVSPPSRPLSMEVESLSIDVDGDSTTFIRSFFLYGGKVYECLVTYDYEDICRFVLCCPIFFGKQDYGDLRMLIISPSSQVLDPENNPEHLELYEDLITAPVL
jgi:hypothetical protein